MAELYAPTYKNLHPGAKSYAVSSPDGAKRHMVAGPPPPPRSHSPSLPGISSMLQLKRSPDDAFMLSPRSPVVSSSSSSSSESCDLEQRSKLYSNNNHNHSSVFKNARDLQARQAAASAVARALAPTSCSSSAMSKPSSCSSTSTTSSTLSSTSSSSSTSISTVTAAPVEKSSRYLREIDRRAILSRIEQGEKQSALAKEYQVSRAAICNLNKHRDEVLSRKNGNPLAKHPKKPRPKTMKAKLGKSGWSAAMALRETGVQDSKGVHEIKSRASALLLTTLRKKHATVSEFRRSSDRLMRLVMEEALAFVPVKTVEIFLPNQGKSDGVALEHPPCAISMEPAGCPMLDLFHLMEPDEPSGYVSFGDMTLSPSDSQAQDVQAKICGSRLPGSLNYHNVFIMDHVITSAEVVIAVVRRLQERGAVEAMISLVALIAAPEAVDKIHAAFPTLKIVIAQVDNGGDESSSPCAAGPIDSSMRASTTDMILDRLEQVYHGYTPATAY